MDTNILNELEILTFNLRASIVYMKRHNDEKQLKVIRLYWKQIIDLYYKIEESIKA